MSPTACMNLHLLSMCCFLSFSSSFFPMWGFSGCSFFFFMNFLCGCCGGDALSHRASSTASCGEFQHCTGRREGVDRRTHHSTSLFLDTICWFVSKEFYFLFFLPLYHLAVSLSFCSYRLSLCVTNKHIETGVTLREGGHFLIPKMN